MSSKFDKAFTEAEAQRAAADHARRSQEHEAQRQQRLAREIAEPYLLELAKNVRQRLLDIRVPLQYEGAPNPKGWRAMFKGPFGFWPFPDLAGPYYSPTSWRDKKPRLWWYTGLCLTGDGYFVMDSRMRGPEGFAQLMREIKIANAIDHLYRPRHGEPFVDIISHSIFIFMNEGFENPDYKAYEIEPYLANAIARLPR